MALLILLKFTLAGLIACLEEELELQTEHVFSSAQISQFEEQAKIDGIH